MKNITFLDSIKCAVKGMKYAFKTEKNFKQKVFSASVLRKHPDYVMYQ